MVQRKDKPETPDKDSLDKDFSDFENAIKSVSNIFTRARYFFEEIGGEYTYIEYPVGQINSLINSLDKTYNSFINMHVCESGFLFSTCAKSMVLEIIGIDDGSDSFVLSLIPSGNAAKLKTYSQQLKMNIKTYDNRVAS